jgi:hypothetical protein
MARTKTETKRKPASAPPAKRASGNDRGKLNKIGALWMSEGKNGKFMSGRITLDDGETEVRILVFKNGYKEQAKHPDYVIYEPGDDNRKGITDDDLPF